MRRSRPFLQIAWITSSACVTEVNDRLLRLLAHAPTGLGVAFVIAEIPENSPQNIA
jgi:hypothetical protein